MKNIFKFLFLNAVFMNLALADTLNTGSASLWGKSKFEKADTYADGYAPFFVNLQDSIANIAILGIAIAIIVFAIHHFTIGAKTFSHDGKKILAFGGFERLIHLIAAVSCSVLVLTGLIMLFGKTFGGAFAGICRSLHEIATIAFAISIVPMFFIWFVKMLPTLYDLKWFAILGGYLSKTKRPIPAGKFNAGQKLWFWVATLGGVVLLASGAIMFFTDYNTAANSQILGLNGAEALRLCAILHSIFGVICAIFLCVHIYMSVFGVKGSLESMISGFKSEEEIYLLHHYWYQDLVKQGKIQKSSLEEKYKKL